LWNRATTLKGGYAMKGFHLGRFIMTVAVILVIVGIASRVPQLRKLVFNTAA